MAFENMGFSIKKTLDEMLIVILLFIFLLSLTSFLDSIVKFVNRGKCQKLIKYQGRTFDFKVSHEERSKLLLNRH
jgi:hypothetical protein